MYTLCMKNVMRLNHISFGHFGVVGKIDQHFWNFSNMSPTFPTKICAAESTKSWPSTEGGDYSEK